MLNRTLILLWPLRRRRGFGVDSLTVIATATVVAGFLLPSMPLMFEAGGGDQGMCGCGCGEPKGKCCCAAPRTSELAMGCTEREDPNQPVDAANGGKIIGPPESINLSHPIPASAELADLELDFTDLDPRPEVPPPRS